MEKHDPDLASKLEEYANKLAITYSRIETDEQALQA